MRKNTIPRTLMFSDGYLAHGDFVYRHEPAPVFIRGVGSFLEDADGYKYLDAEAANGTASLGFDNTILQQAVKRSQNIPSVPSFCETEIRMKVANRIGIMLQNVTGIKGDVAFELGGAQGVELALKVVKSNTKKSQFVVFEGAYHGRSIFTSQLSASHRYRSLMGDWRIPVIRLPYPDIEQSGYTNRKQFLKHTLAQIHRLVTSEVGGVANKSGEQDIAALILEPVLNAGGIVRPEKDYIEEVVKIFRGLGALIVVDEIFCGFHRTGPMFGFQHYSFTPDIVIMSKALTNGLAPLSCVWARDPYMLPTHFPPGTHSATFINNPFILSVADVVLDRYEAWSTIQKDIKNLEKSLNSLCSSIGKTFRFARSGFAIGGMGRILLKRNTASIILDVARTVSRKKPIEGVHGLILASTGMTPNVVAVNPPLTINKQELGILETLLFRTFEQAASKMK